MAQVRAVILQHPIQPNKVGIPKGQSSPAAVVVEAGTRAMRATAMFAPWMRDVATYLKWYVLWKEAAHLPARPETIARGWELQTHGKRLPHPLCANLPGTQAPTALKVNYFYGVEFLFLQPCSDLRA